MPNRYMLLGPPGTGKTSTLVNQVAKWATEYGPESLLLASFTRAGAKELAGRANPVSPEFRHLRLRENQMGTLHAHALRAIGKCRIVGGSLLKEWNEEFPALPIHSRSSITEDVFDTSAPAAGGEGSRLLGLLSMFRSKMVPEVERPFEVIEFGRLWEAWKRGNDAYDFDDLIERAVAERALPPDDAINFICDEAQDFTMLDMSLVHLWSERMENVLLAGDDDQAIYGFRGGDHRAMSVGFIDDATVRVLRQSWRVPRAVHGAAVSWVGQLQGRRIEKEYEPRDADGAVLLRHDASWENCLPVIREIEKQIVEDAKVHSGNKVMVLASCGYMLKPLCAALRERGIGFHNPYQQEQGAWNPLRSGSDSRVTVLDRVLAFLRPNVVVHGEKAAMWTYGELARWTADIRVGTVMARGAKKKILAEDPLGVVDSGLLSEWFLPLWDADDWQAMRSGDIDWFLGALTDSARKRYGLVVRMVQRDPVSVLSKPEVIVGTVHSVKGGEADHVHLFPDLSREGMLAWQRGREGADEVVRMFYVGMTRAFDTLTVWGPAGWAKVDPSLLVRGGQV